MWHSWPVRYLVPEVPVIVLGTLAFSFMVSRWHFFGRLPLLPVNWLLIVVVAFREARGASDSRLGWEMLLAPFFELGAGWDAEAALWPKWRQVRAIAGIGIACLYSWRVAGLAMPRPVPGIWLPVLPWCVLVFVYVYRYWSSESGLQNTRLYWRALMQSRRTTG